MKNQRILNRTIIVFLVSFGLMAAKSEVLAAISPKNKAVAKKTNAVVSTDQVEAEDLHRKDGKIDTWTHKRNGQIYLKEFDRNFDGKADLQVFESNGKFTEKKYDDNYDGKYDRTEKALPKGSSGITPTSPKS